jgi:A/G-specific adenine glycosylase
MKISSKPEISVKVKRAFHENLATWYRGHARDLPWRRTRDPYAIVVSEFMLQQTQVATVLPYYDRWLKVFPSWLSLAQAEAEAVVKAWEGLGYYSRARNLHRLAQEIVRRGGVVPVTPEELVRLPGIGPYTAGAVASLAGGQRAALVDGNVMRVFARVFAWHEDIASPVTQRKMWQVADSLLPEAQNCAGHNSALMELGAMICTPRRPHCLECPLAAVCQTTEPEALPVKTRKKVEERYEELAVIRRGPAYWLAEGPTRGRLAGFWRFPEFDEATMIRQEKIGAFTYGITRYRVRLQAWQASWRGPSAADGRWWTAQEMEAISMSAAQRRVRSLIKEESIDEQ